MRPRHALATLVLLAAAGCGDDNTGSDSDADPAEEALAQIDALKPPRPDLARADDEEYFASFRQEYKDHWSKKGGLIEAFYTDYPNHSRTAVLIDQYWSGLMLPNLTVEETEAIIERIEATGDSSTNPDVVRHARYWTAVYSTHRDQAVPSRAIRHAFDFSDEFSYDTRGATLFRRVADSEYVDPETLAIAFGALVSRYPNTEHGKIAATMGPLVRFIGEPFEMEFVDALSGKTVNMRTLRGKIVVVDFWATWCPPCVAAVPLMKQVFDMHSREDLEYVGVNMDSVESGGLELLKSFTDDFEIDWPQYFVGDDASLPLKYGVQALPTMFVLDRKGVVRSISGVGTMPRMIDLLLAE